MKRRYEATLSVTEWEEYKNPGLARGWVDAQIERIAPTFGAVIETVSSWQDPVELRMHVRVDGYYLEDE